MSLISYVGGAFANANEYVNELAPWFRLTHTFPQYSNEQRINYYRQYLFDSPKSGPSNFDEFLENTIKQANLNDGDAQFTLGEALYSRYLDSSGTDLGLKVEEKELAKGWFSLAAENGNPHALTRLGVIHYEDEDFDRAYEFFAAARSEGDALAAVNVALMLMKKNDPKGLEYLEDSAKEDDALSKLVLVFLNSWSYQTTDNKIQALQFILENEANHNDFSDAHSLRLDRLIITLSFIVALIAFQLACTARKKVDQIAPRRIEMVHRYFDLLDREDRYHHQLVDDNNELRRQLEEMRQKNEMMRPDILLGTRRYAVSLLQLADAVLHDQVHEGTLTEFQYLEIQKLTQALFNSMPTETEYAA